MTAYEMRISDWSSDVCSSDLEFALAQAFGVSRSPIREACRKLEQAGMVEIIKNRGMFVCSIDLQRAMDIYEIRGALAGLAGKLIVQRATDDDIAALRLMVARMDVTVESRSEARRVGRACGSTCGTRGSQ